MGLPNQFNDIVQQHLKVYAAWMPVTNNYELGDYGIFVDGVFAKLGNIQEFNVSFTTATGPEATIDFTSADTRVIKFAAGAEVDVIPAGAVSAKITFKFQRERSFLVKAPTIKVNEIQNVKQVADQVKKVNSWERKWKVVYQTYEAMNSVILSSIAADTDVTFSGNASALKDFKLGDASLQINSTKELGLKIHGKSGVIGLGLFKLQWIGGGINMLGGADVDVEIQTAKTVTEDL